MEHTQQVRGSIAPQESAKTNPSKISHAVILAAGNGERFREQGTELPKVLLRVGGLRLLERSVLTLREAGIEHFRIVTGAYGDQIRKTLASSDRLQELDITFVDCPDYHLGNGKSLAAGAAPIDEPFLLTMADHVFSPSLIKEFVSKAAASDSHLPALACDADIENVYDLDDATKVQSVDGRINRIGKEIKKYNLIDTGLFYYPAGCGRIIGDKASAGANSVSDIVGQLIDEKGFRTIALENNMWQDVDYPGMKQEAEKRLLKSLIKSTDGWVSKNLNRHISTRISLFLSQYNFTPNMMTTFVFFFTLVGAYFAASGEYLYIALGGLIFQIASILDGCDGELARLKLLGSRFGAWYDTLTDNIRYIIFFAALGVSAYRAGGAEIYLYAIPLFLVLGFYIAGRMASFTWNNKGALTNLEVSKKVDEITTQGQSFWDKLIKNLRGIDKQDVSAFIAFVLCLVGLHMVMFWLVFAGSIVVSITLTRTFWKDKKKVAEKKKRKFKVSLPLVFYFLGIILLGVLIYRMDILVISQSLSKVGAGVFLVFAAAIPTFIANTMCLANLTRHRIPWLDTLYVEVTGDAYNNIIPMAGLGGEPYKIKTLTNWISIDEASRAIIQDRLIHSMTGIFFTAIAAGLTVALVPLGTEIKLILSVSAVVFSIVTALMVWVTLSSVPTRLSGFILRKLKILQEYKNEPLPVSRFLISFCWKMLGRTLNLAEIFLIFYLLGFWPDFADLITVSAMISMSATVFFIVPQGLGVNEAGVSTAFSLIGLTASAGLTFGLIRRARVIFWALLGVAIHLTVALLRKGVSERIVELMARQRG